MRWGSRDDEQQIGSNRDSTLLGVDWHNTTTACLTNTGPNHIKQVWWRHTHKHAFTAGGEDYPLT